MNQNFYVPTMHKVGRVLTIQEKNTLVEICPQGHRIRTILGKVVYVSLSASPECSASALDPAPKFSNSSLYIILKLRHFLKLLMEKWHPAVLHTWRDSASSTAFFRSKFSENRLKFLIRWRLVFQPWYMVRTACATGSRRASRPRGGGRLLFAAT